jgi:hypothetical protein
VQHRSDHGIDLGWREVRDAPSPQPAIQLRQLLSDARSAGESFMDIWKPSIDLVLGGIHDSHDRAEWSTAFQTTSMAWNAAYCGSATTYPLSIELLDDAYAAS